MAQWPIGGGVGGSAAASPLAGARAHREVDAPPSSGLVVVPFTAEPEAWPRGGVTTTVGGVPLPRVASSAMAGGGDGAGDPQVGENPFQSVLSFLIRDHS